MYGTVNKRNDIFNSSDETVLEDRPLVITDFITLLEDINDISGECNVLTKGIEMTFGDIPLEVFNCVIVKHIDIIDLIFEKIKRFKKDNRLIISKLREEREKNEKKKEKETKPVRRKTELL
ncbi:hypothetical protein EDI_114370 [Entamoeba dispar SAW760]|uniref:Uncharacterized protein n=1 Tax=Entamoeba dispar (strain ATCC PRA-260 / SAW760) TaxID=370354 RepID=B0ELV5_ENTDS|nr:uncharacterized protein EDI_114370 [Entamoeba dispar SAW760]EDR24498.1 hypothetical protein EDI_114370 [Entamoeba dispar SAW760]|eukprot:EDR24498.1 hypothetical protein EDI_114370 [Entamoeba dispar SAW760]